MAVSITFDPSNKGDREVVEQILGDPPTKTRGPGRKKAADKEEAEPKKESKKEAKKDYPSLEDLHTAAKAYAVAVQDKDKVHAVTSSAAGVDKIADVPEDKREATIAAFNKALADFEKADTGDDLDI